MTLAYLDWVFLGVLLLSLVVGAWRGLVYEVLSLANWVLAFVLAQWFAPALAQRLTLSGASEVLRYALAFVLVFVAVLFIGTVFNWLVSKLFHVAGLRPADRALGAIFGLLRGVLLLLAFAVLATMTPLKSQAWWTDSSAQLWLTATLKGLKPVLPRDFGKYLP